MFDIHPQSAAFATAAPLRVIQEKPSISVVGLGYVGAVSTACLSSLGHRVVGVDVDLAKVVCIGEGRSPIHEQDLEEMLQAGVAEQPQDNGVTIDGRLTEPVGQGYHCGYQHDLEN